MAYRNRIDQTWDKVWIGILVGLAVPFAGYGILLMLYDQIDQLNLLSGEGMALNFRARTIGLIALILNIVPLQIFNRRNAMNSMRGIVFPTLFYVALWMYFYGLELLGY